MAVWDSNKVKQHPQIVKDFDALQVKSGAYELALGDAAVTNEKGNPNHLKLVEGQSFEILPGQFGLLLTKETIDLPADVQGKISIKTKIKFKGLLNISGVHVDPGFKGRLKFSVQNAGGQPIILQQGQVLFQLWFEEMTGSDVPYGYKKEHDIITADDLDRLKGYPVSPVIALAKIDEISKDVSIMRTALTTLTISVLVAVGVFSLTTALRISDEVANKIGMALANRISSPQNLAAGNPPSKNLEKLEPSSQVPAKSEPEKVGQEKKSSH
ncbi:MAG: hypothetical protein M3Q07_12940 [Pseudobdellovibrionaceae bacterium]|nr:hypothetical protein [Pseudobdellovibrionaceae bacterium]